MSDTKIQIFDATGGTAAIDYRTEATNGDGRQVVVVGDPAFNNNVAAVATQDLGGTDQTTAGLVFRLAGSAAVQIVGAPNTMGVYLDSTKGTVVVKIDPAGAVFTNNANTASIFSVSGSTSGVSVSGVQLIAPSANYSFKVFAFSLQTTGAVSLTAKFTNGSGGSPTEFWRPLVTISSSSGAQGANLAVPPPGYLFATGTNTTLALVLDTASLVHYSVSYIKETA